MATKIGKVYLVGAGPGDPGLLTLKGQRCLALADVVLYDGLVNPLLLRHTRAEAIRTCREAGPHGKRLNQAEINQRLVDEAMQGRCVVRLKGGDPFIFGRGSEEAAALAEQGIPFEVVPGITAATAAAAYAGISLTHRDHASAVALITGHEDPTKPETALDYAELARFPGTLVFYMGMHRLPHIVQALRDQGKSAETPVGVISHGSQPMQRTVTGTLATIVQCVEAAQLHPPSLIIVGDCVTQRESIDWFERLPLFGQRIGITRPEGQADSVVDQVLALGGAPVLIPTMQIRSLRDWSAVDAELDRLAGTDWLVFTSVNGVDAFLGRLWERGGDARQLANVRIACIGGATSQRLAQFHLHADLVPETFRAEALAEALAPHVQNKRVLWARANRGRDVLPEVLTQAGANYAEVVVYEHVDVDALPPEIDQWIVTGQLDWVGLSSPAIARHFAKQLSPAAQACLGESTQLAVISPVTEAAAIEVGLPVAAVATTHTWPGILTAIRDAMATDSDRT
ncbi:MAG: uroporphyrinogen-III C-methyltransferase [Planctomycetaceae bacterium]|nr:uroporphyrinogen-III C-methyltransferase [Planctomycetaceae bacterium]